VSLEEAFLRDIHERPHDDTPRLVYADWLDDNGRPERAEFIRVQCRLAELPTGHPERPALEKRQHALWKKNAKAWRKPLPRPGREGPFYRGFVVPTFSPTVRELTGGAAPPDCAPLWEVHVSDGGVEGLDLAAHPLMARAVHLWLWQKLVPAEWLRRFLSSPAVAHLVGFQHWFSHADAAAARAVAESPYLAGLTHLNLGNNPLGPEGGRALAASQHLRRLRWLRLCVAELGDEGVIALAGSPVLDSVTQLEISTNNLTDRAADALLESPHLAHLRTLQCSSTDFSEGRRQALQKRFGKNKTYAPLPAWL
jgi:uncharacterized protein (TIGR02996 family)